MHVHTRDMTVLPCTNIIFSIKVGQEKQLMRLNGLMIAILLGGAGVASFV